MPLWGTILTVCFSGIVALISVINLFRSATRERVEQLENRLTNLIDRIDRRLANLEQRIDRHLENHP